MLSEVPSGWEVYTVGDLVEFQGGSQPPLLTFSSQPRPGYVRLIQIRDYKSNSYATYVPRDHKLTRRFCDEEDVMIGRYGPPVFQILRGLTGAYNVALIKAIPKREISRDYLFYFLSQRTLFTLIDGLSGRTSGQTGVDMEALRNFIFLLPPLEERCEIVAILSSVDEAIQATQAVIEQTRRVKEGLLQELLTKGIGQTRFKQTEIGEIPDKWEVKKLGELCEARQGLQIPISERRSSPGEGLYPYLTVRFLSDPSAKVEFVPANSPRVLIQPDGILLARTGATGRVIRNVSGVFHNNFFAVDFSPSRLTRDFLYHTLQSSRVQGLIQALAGSTSIPDLNHGDFYFISIVVPPINEQVAIAEKLDHLDQFVAANKSVLERLGCLKEGLLQDLLTGKVRVSV